MSVPNGPQRPGSSLPPSAAGSPPSGQPQPLRPQPIPARPVPLGQPQPLAQPQPVQPRPVQPAAPVPQPAQLPQPAQPRPITAQPRPADVQPNFPQGVQPQPVLPRPAAAQPAAPRPIVPGMLPPGAQPQPLRPMPAQPGGSLYIRQRHDDDEVETETELAQRLLKMSTPMLASAIVHMLLLIVLGLWMFQEHFRVEIEIIASTDGNEDIFDSVAVMASPLENVTELAAPPLLTVARTDPFASKATIDPFGTAPAMNLEGAMAGRSETAQNYMVGKRGGTKASQSAVGNGLKWLADQQDKKTGKWKLQGHDRKGNIDLVLNENFQAATAMALLAFQGAGHTHRSGKYAANVERGLKYLLSNQTSDGNFCSRGVSRDEVLYAHAQCTIAVCELLAMTKDEKLQQVAEDAVKFCIAAQDLDENTGGGWRYTPGRDSDTSVTGWMLVALKSATYAGIAVPTEVFTRVSRYLDQATNEDGFKVTAGGKDFVCSPGVLYRYYLDKPPDRVMTAEGILMRQYLGWPQNDPRIAMAAEILLTESNLPKWEERDVYYWYYATQMFSHLDGEPWKKWNGAMRDQLVQKQVQDGGEKGSWHPFGTGTTNPLVGADYWAANGAGGRHYVTCMSLYILEVYYRHLPIYQIKGRENTAR